jgi:hypothetical protein
MSYSCYGMCIAPETLVILQSRRISRTLAIATLALAFFTTCQAQELKGISKAELRALIEKSLSKDRAVADEANAKLSALTVRDLSTLLAITKTGPTCHRVKAAQAIVDLDKENRTLLPILVELSTEGDAFSSEEDLLCRRGATFLLAFSAQGIRILTSMLKEGKNLFIRRSAIFAFDELTETGNYPEGSLEAMKEAIPVIAQSRKLDDEVMQSMSNEVLWQIVRRRGSELSKIAESFVGADPK